VLELVTGVGIMLGERPQAACEGLDADRDQRSRIHELVDAVFATLQGCAAALPTVAGRRGTYDATLTGSGGGPFAGTRQVVAEVTDYDDGTGLRIQLKLRANVGVTLSGRFDGVTAALAGIYFVTDYGVPLVGTATVGNTDDEEVIEGSFHTAARGSEEFDASFVLRHSHALTPERFAGRYEFQATSSPGDTGEPSAFTIGLDIAPDGAALMTEATDVGTSDMVLGRLTSGECSIAPGGHLYCKTLYLVADSDHTALLRFTGVLSSTGAETTGRGDFLSGQDPPIGGGPYVPGGWTARRLSDTP
jgi:hypothetical protein